MSHLESVSQGHAVPPAASGALRLPRLFDAGLDAVVVTALVAQLAITLVSVTLRALAHSSILWADDSAKLTLPVIAFLGGAIAYRRGQHAAIMVGISALPPFWREVCRALVEYLVLIVTVAAGLASIGLFRSRLGEVLPMLGLSGAWSVVPFTLGMVVVALTALERLTGFARAVHLAVAGVLALIALGLWAVWEPWTDVFASDHALPLIVAIFALAVLLSMPVGLALMLTTLAFLASTDIPTIALPQNMLDANSNFILLSLPFFILAGAVMEQGGISVRFVQFAMALVGHLRGGLLQVVVITIYLISGISGSKAADVAAVGSVMKAELEKRGYSAREGAAVLSASAAMAETIPPSIAMLVLGSVTPISIGTLFMAGLLPAAVIAVFLMVLIYALARRRGEVASPRMSARAIGRSAASAILPLAMPVFMVLGIKFGFATPTEISAFAVAYGLVLALFVYRALEWRALVRVGVNAAVLSGMVLFIVAAAGAFGWTLSAADLHTQLIDLLALAGNNHTVFMLGSILLLMVVGALLEGLPALIILGPVLLPIAAGLGIDAVHYGIVMILAMGVGIFMPPIGIGFYISCAVMGASVERTSQAMMPYFLTLLAGVLTVAFVPWFTHAVPRLFAG
ncbi:TRAP transporter large permease subunit [Aquabacter cavernae]|uniref:TRAP transporter large permease n=1 Tax=Aquabacter cavernae TaxID=2496029 RepID=UPI000F8EB519|nr:TRAP transporter large permease subunit [Aquabacter cavernae]